MLNFLLDITPDKSQLLITIKLAGILREKKQEVYYTYTSNPALKETRGILYLYLKPCFYACTI